jgi:hypothetical protein
MISDLMGLQPVIWGSRSATSEVDGATTEPRIRINRPADESARCKGSRAQAQPRDFSQPTQPHTIPSTSNAISFQPEHTEPFVRRLWTCGAQQLQSLENVLDAEFSRSFFDNVTAPGRDCFGQILAMPIPWPTALVHSSQRHWCAERRKCAFCCHPDALSLLFLIGHKTIKRFTSILPPPDPVLA